MMTRQSEVLDVILAHPGGIRTVDIAEALEGYDRWSRHSLIGQPYTRCRSLERWGDIWHELIDGQAVWSPMGVE
jgi:hypothetical protein